MKSEYFYFAIFWNIWITLTRFLKYPKVLNLAFYSTERSLEDRISIFYNVFSTTDNGPSRQYGGELYLLWFIQRSKACKQKLNRWSSSTVTAYTITSKKKHFNIFLEHLSWFQDGVLKGGSRLGVSNSIFPSWILSLKMYIWKEYKRSWILGWYL